MAPKAFLYEDTLMALARVQELGGKSGAAIETYQRLLKELPDTRRADDLKTHLANLKSRVGQYVPPRTSPAERRTQCLIRSIMLGSCSPAVASSFNASVHAAPRRSITRTALPSLRGMVLGGTIAISGLRPR